MKKLELSIGNEKESFFISQDNVTKEEIIRVYKAYKEEYKRDLAIDEFVKELSQYGIALDRIEVDLISIQL